MKVIIAGSRGCPGVITVRMALRAAGLTPDMVTEIVSGKAPGADRMGEKVAAMHDIPVKRFPANWLEHGKAAGYIRNAEMAEYGDRLVAVWDGMSPGTRNMIALMHKQNKPVHVYRY